MPCLFSREVWVETGQNNATRQCSLLFGKFLSGDTVRSQTLKCCSVQRLSKHTVFLANMINMTKLHCFETTGFRTNAKRQKLRLAAVLCCDWLLRFAVRVKFNEKWERQLLLSRSVVKICHSSGRTPLLCFRLNTSAARAAKLSFELSLTGKEVAMCL